MDFNFNINKMCRVCWEDGVLTSIFNTEFAITPAEMMALCAKIRIYKDDGLPTLICNNCIYRLGNAYQFKQHCEESDRRLRIYFGIHEKGFGTRDNETNTDQTGAPYRLTTASSSAIPATVHDDDDDDSDEQPLKPASAPAPTRKSRSRYKRKLPEERKKRGPKPQPKATPTCYECHKTFKCPAQLQLHIRTHTGDRPYVCTYCPRRFAQKHNLAIHVRTHTGERPFQCEICSKQFAALGNFQAHKKIHTGVRDQVCPVCSKAFVTAGDLARHMQTHTGIKNHHCDVCGKAFSRNRDMVAHKKKLHHVGDDQQPLQQQQQQQHQSLHHQQQQQHQHHDHNHLQQQHQQQSATEAAYKCRECPKLFANALSLASHERTHDAGGTGMAGTSMSGGMLGASGSSTLVMPIAQTAMNNVGGLMTAPIGQQSLQTHHHHEQLSAHPAAPAAPAALHGHMEQAMGGSLGMMHPHPHHHAGHVGLQHAATHHPHAQHSVAPLSVGHHHHHAHHGHHAHHPGVHHPHVTAQRLHPF